MAQIIPARRPRFDKARAWRLLELAAALKCSVESNSIDAMKAAIDDVSTELERMARSMALDKGYALRKNWKAWQRGDFKTYADCILYLSASLKQYPSPNPVAMAAEIEYVYPKMENIARDMSGVWRSCDTARSIADGAKALPQ